MPIKHVSGLVTISYTFLNLKHESSIRKLHIMSSSKDPPAKNTRSAHARREEERKAQITLHGEGQSHYDPGGAAAPPETAAPPGVSLTAEPSQEIPRLYAEESPVWRSETLDSELFHALASEPQPVAKQSFVTAPISFTMARNPIVFGSLTPEGRSPTPEPIQDKGKQRADIESPPAVSERTGQEVVSQIKHLRSEHEAMRSDLHKWVEATDNIAQVLQGRMASSEPSQQYYAQVYNQIKQSKKLFQTVQQDLDDMDIPLASKRMLQALPRALAGQEAQIECGSAGEATGSHRCQVMQM